MTIEVLHRARRVVRDAERGVSAIILAISMTAIMGAAALGFDLATLAYVKQVVRNAVDSAAQIGASQLGSGVDSTSTINVTQQAFNRAYSGNYTGWGNNYPQSLSVVSATDPRTQNVLKISLLCVVANPALPTDPTVSAQAASVCGVTSYTASDVKCSDAACAVPCPATAACNSVSVSANVTVNYLFAPAINITSGDTGAVTTLSCACGDPSAPNPMNVVVMADRTPSMFNDDGAKTGNGDKDLNALKSGIQSMLKVMAPVQQYVAFGAIHKSLPKVSSGNLTTPPGSTDNLFTYTSTSSDQYSNKVTSITSSGITSAICTAAKYYWRSNNCYTTSSGNTKVTSITNITSAVCAAASYYWDGSACYKNKTTNTTTTRNDLFNGTWVPVAFENNYLNAAGTDLNTNTDLYKSVTNLTYSNGTSNGKKFTSYYNADGLYGNTHLAAAMKGAARYLLGKDPNNIATLDAASKRPDTYGTPRNVIIFETDGAPAEVFTNATSTTSDVLKLDNTDDIGNTDGEQACQNFKQVAQYAKDAGITIITIGFGDAASSSTYCSSSNKKTKTSAALAAAASPLNGVPAAADKACADENKDGDNYYCAANGDDLAKVFRAALGSLGGGTKFMSIPGVGN